MRPVGVERRTLVPRMPGLAADLVLLAASGRILGRREDVAGGRLGGIRRVLLEAGDLVVQLLVVAAQLLILLAELLVLPSKRGHLGLERFQPRQQPPDA
jgi:hypothetical protein